MEYPILQKAPITEALIDIRIKGKDDSYLRHLKALHEKVSVQYPQVKERHKWEGKFEFRKGVGPSSAATEKIDGYMFTSDDKKQLFQARLDGFTFNRLRPYDKWVTLRDEAFRLWQIYKELLLPEIVRVAVRYINKFDIPSTMRDFNEYLVAPPIIPSGLPQGIVSFLNRVVIHDPETDASAIVTQAFEQIVDPKYLPIIFDIDVFRQKSEGIDEVDAWETLDKLRDFKNKIFFQSITDKTKELFQ
jgi:uncharacterized protein (TIGR04255 family)